MEGTPEKTWWDCVKDDKQSFGMTCEDGQNTDDWRVRTKHETGQPRFPWKMAIQMVCV